MSIFKALDLASKIVGAVVTAPSAWTLLSEREANMSRTLDFSHLTDLSHSFGTAQGVVGEAQAQRTSLDIKSIEDFDYTILTQSSGPSYNLMTTTDFLLYLAQKGYKKQRTFYTFSFGEKLDVPLCVVDHADRGHWCLDGDFSHIVDREPNAIEYNSEEINMILGHYHKQFGGLTGRMEYNMEYFSYEEDEEDEEDERL